VESTAPSVPEQKQSRRSSEEISFAARNAASEHRRALTNQQTTQRNSPHAISVFTFSINEIIAPSMRFALIPALLVSAAHLRAGTLDTIGVTQLRSTDASLTGSNVFVAQPESPSSDTAQDFEVNPTATQHLPALFTYLSGSGDTSAFPNTIGNESGHANEVGQLFYGESNGVAPNVKHVNNFKDSFFYSTVITNGVPIRAKVVNQSFVISADSSGSSDVNRRYDDYISRYHAVIVSGIGNSGAVLSPAACFNGIGVGAYGGSSSVGPTSDGRSKPDIVAPADETSFSTPLVSGAAAVLVQAAKREKGSAALTASDPRTIKALLLNGAEKPSDWTHSDTAPLDSHYGAGVLNVFNSYEDLGGGRHKATHKDKPLLTAGHPAANVAPTFEAMRGWDFSALMSSARCDAVSHYVFDLENAAAFTLKGTLVWQRKARHTSINNLDLFLLNAATNEVIASSLSTVDNIEHLFIQNLLPGRYDLEVVKYGGEPGSNDVATTHEQYALVWDFTAN
jgi:hypothetical protein